jgi:adenylate kinase
VFYRAIKWRLSQNDCKNRGYILDNFPSFEAEADIVFTPMGKKLKRKVKKKVEKPPEPPKVE